jgi:integrase/recombinase XerD
LEVLKSDITHQTRPHLLMDKYLQNLERLNKSDHTIKNYRADLLKFLVWLHSNQDLKLEKVNGETIGLYKEFLNNGGNVYKRAWINFTGYIAFWLKKILQKTLVKSTPEKELLYYQMPMSVSSRRRHLSSLKNFFEYLKESHEDSSDKFLKNPVKSKIHAITLKDIDITPTAMLARADFKIIEEKTFRTNERLMLYLLYYAGLRLSELCFLKISNFDFQTRTITFTRKGGSVHTLAVQKEEIIFKNLKFYLEQNKFYSDFLFQNKEGRPYSLKAMYNKIMKIIKRADLVDVEITPHSFRKACATELYMKSRDLLYVRDYLNHKDAKVTQTYIDKKTLSMKTRRYH